MDRNQARQIIKENWEQLLQDITPVAKMREPYCNRLGLVMTDLLCVFNSAYSISFCLIFLMNSLRKSLTEWKTKVSDFERLLASAFISRSFRVQIISAT